MLLSAQDYGNPCAEFNNKRFSINKVKKGINMEVVADDCLAASTSKGVTSIKNMSHQRIDFI